MIVDTSALLAFFNSREPAHEAVAAAILEHEDALVVSPFVIAELDYVLATRVGITAELAALRELAGGAWSLPAFDTDALAIASRIIERYRDQEIGLADASNVVLAHQFGTRTIATLDHRHFDVVRPLGGGRFSVLP